MRWFSKWQTYMNLLKEALWEMPIVHERFFGCGKEGHRVRDFPTIVYRGREGNQVVPNIPKDNSLNKRHFYALET